MFVVSICYTKEDLMSKPKMKGLAKRVGKALFLALKGEGFKDARNIHVSLHVSKRDVSGVIGVFPKKKGKYAR